MLLLLFCFDFFVVVAVVYGVGGFLGFRGFLVGFFFNEVLGFFFL